MTAITGKLIRQWRVNHGVTLRQAAQEAGVGIVELGEVERGVAPVSEALRAWWEQKQWEGLAVPHGFVEGDDG